MLCATTLTRPSGRLRMSSARWSARSLTPPVGGTRGWWNSPPRVRKPSAMLRKYRWRRPPTAISSKPRTPWGSTTGWRSLGARLAGTARRNRLRFRAKSPAATSVASATASKIANCQVMPRSYPQQWGSSRGEPRAGHVAPPRRRSGLCPRRAEAEGRSIRTPFLLVVVVVAYRQRSDGLRRCPRLVVRDDPQFFQATRLQLPHPLAGEGHDRAHLLERDAAPVRDVEGAGVGDLPQILVGEVHLHRPGARVHVHVEVELAGDVGAGARTGGAIAADLRSRRLELG